MPKHALLLIAGLCAWTLSGCAGTATPHHAAATPSTPTPAPAPAAAPAPAPEPAAPSAPRIDSTGVDPRPDVLIPGMDFVGVRTRLIPHVMGKGWMLSVNKGDSLEFLRPADPALAQMLFGLVPPAGTRIRLRFRIVSATDGTRITGICHLVGPSGPLAYRASKELLAQSLEELKTDLLTAPVSQDPPVDRVKTKKKK